MAGARTAPEVILSREAQQSSMPFGPGQQSPRRPAQPEWKAHCFMKEQSLSPSGYSGSGTVHWPSPHMHCLSTQVALRLSLHPRTWQLAPVSLPHCVSFTFGGVMSSEAQHSRLDSLSDDGQHIPSKSEHLVCMEHSALYLQMPPSAQKPSAHMHFLSMQAALRSALHGPVWQVPPVSFWHVGAGDGAAPRGAGVGAESFVSGGGRMSACTARSDSSARARRASQAAPIFLNLDLVPTA